MLQFDEYKIKLQGLIPELDVLELALNPEQLERELDMLEAESGADGFWDNLDKSQTVLQRIKQLRNKLDAQKKRRAQWEDLVTLCEMGNEAEDETLVPELESEFEALSESIKTARLQTLLTGQYDMHSAILTFHAGAGGTEAQDWTQMLYRMYTRWAERHGFSYKVVDYLDGDEAGLKSATIIIEGENVYGYLKGEH
ncbi:MAG: PCRF domain-containing protein, partial [Evtepia sp.]